MTEQWEKVLSLLNGKGKYNQRSITKRKQVVGHTWTNITVFEDRIKIGRRMEVKKRYIFLSNKLANNKIQTKNYYARFTLKYNHSVTPKDPKQVPYLFYCYYYYNYLLIIVFHISFTWWSFTGVWVTASLIMSPGLFSVFWPFSIMLQFGWSPLVLQMSSPPVP